MRLALALARRGLGNVAPNPAVGCVLVRDGTVVGRGWTQPGGRPHAETEALARAGTDAKDATAYLSLEPCSHHGRTPPCSEALIAAGVNRVVVACEDPDTRVSGAGIAALEKAGIDVTPKVLGDEATQLNAGFMRVKGGGRPFVTLKLATTLDGQIATATGESRWITGPVARRQVHRLRAAHDAVLTGMGTVRADDPELTVRLPGLPLTPPVRVIMASVAALDAGGRLRATAGDAPVWLVVPEGRGAGDRRRHRAGGCGPRGPPRHCQRLGAAGGNGHDPRVDRGRRDPGGKRASGWRSRPPLVVPCGQDDWRRRPPGGRCTGHRLA